MRNKIIFSSFIAILLFIVFTACQQPGSSSGGSSGNHSGNQVYIQPISYTDAFGLPSSATIGSGGGTLSSPDEILKLTIPAGALNNDTLITIQPHVNDSTNDSKTGLIYSLLPEGQTFLLPVSLTFKYTDNELNGSSPDSLGIIYQDTDNKWVWVDNPVIDTTAKTVTVTTDHFSKWQKMDNFGFSLTPQSQNNVVLVGNTITFQVEFTSKNLPANALVTNWAVNDIKDGNPTIGTVTVTNPAEPMLQTAVYTAPATKPDPNMVTLSLNIRDGTKNTKFLAIIYIYDTNAYFGTARFSGIRRNLSNGNEEIWHGTAFQIYNFSRIDGDMIWYTLDTARSFIIMRGYDKYETTGSGHLTYPAGPGASSQTGFLATLINPALNSYKFDSIITSIQGEMLWTPKNPHNLPYFIDVYPGTAITTSPGGGDPGFRVLGTGKTLVGSVNYNEITASESISITIVWDFQKAE